MFTQDTARMPIATGFRHVTVTAKTQEDCDAATAYYNAVTTGNMGCEERIDRARHMCMAYGATYVSHYAKH